MFKLVKEIDTPEVIKEKLPVPQQYKKIKAKRDLEIRNIIAAYSKKILLIIGPCSADNEDAVLDYITRLKKVAEKIKDKVVIIPRVYTNKPRTRGEGYKGMMLQPDPEQQIDIQKGILAIRRIHLRALTECEMTCADEMLYPENHSYLDDMLSYVSIGARSSENQQHRLVGSGVDIPLGVKNPMNGSLLSLINSIYAAQIPNEFLYRCHQVKTEGNPFAHAIMRGAVDTNGHNIPNYHYENIIQLSAMYEESKLKNPAIIIDTNHSNSGKNPFEQERIVKEVLANCKASENYARYIKGFMIESYLLDGAQDSSGKIYGKSITDACLGWDKTEQLLYYIAENV